MSLSLLVLTFYLVITKANVFHLFTLTPLICVAYWSDTVLSQMYRYFKKFVLFYAFLSICVEVLVVTKVWIYLPHTIFPPQDFIQENAGLVNYFFGLFCIPATDTSLSFYRACGPLREGGHWVFFIGFVYFTEKALRGKRNIWLIICGILTLSPNFLLFFVVTELYCAVKQKKILKPLLSIVGVFIVIILIFLAVPQSIKDEIIRIIFERLLEASLQNAQDDGWMAFLDGRATQDGLMAYDNYLYSSLHTRLFGENPFDAEGIMSDFRYLLIYIGYIGTAMVLWITCVFTFVRSRSFFNVCVFFLAFAIFMQRAWMYNQAYIWLMILLLTNEHIINVNRTELCRSR